MKPGVVSRCLYPNRIYIRTEAGSGFILSRLAIGESYIPQRLHLIISAMWSAYVEASHVRRMMIRCVRQEEGSQVTFKTYIAFSSSLHRPDLARSLPSSSCMRSIHSTRIQFTNGYMRSRNALNNNRLTSPTSHPDPDTQSHTPTTLPFPHLHPNPSSLRRST